MTTEISTPTYRGCDVPTDLDGMRQLARMLGSATVIPSGWRGPDNTVAAMLLARQLDLTLATVLWEIPVIVGRPTISAKLARHLVRRAGHNFRFVDDQCTDRVAVATLTRCDDEIEHTIRFTIDEAREMGLTHRDNWQQQPGNMLRARVTTRAVTWYASEVVLGVRIDDGDQVDDQDADGGVTVMTTASGTVGPMTAEAVEQARVATTLEQLRTVWDQNRTLLDSLAEVETGQSLRAVILDRKREITGSTDSATGDGGDDVVDLDQVLDDGDGDVGASTDNETRVCTCEREELLRAGVEHFDGCPANHQREAGE